jgi:hypothetical protein
VFGWLAPLRRGEHARAVSSRWLQTPPGALLAGLPHLGCTLYLPPRDALTPLGALPAGALAEQADLTPLLGLCRWRHSSAVTRDGPREWIDGINAHGQRQASLYLLPDTDYLAWDALLARAQPVPVRQRHPQVPELALGAPRLTCFALRRWAGLNCLSAHAPGRVSGLSREVARQIATSHAAIPR